MEPHARMNLFFVDQNGRKGASAWGSKKVAGTNEGTSI
jgi:hypothetical protein